MGRWATAHSVVINVVVVKGRDDQDDQYMPWRIAYDTITGMVAVLTSQGRHR